MSQLSYSFGSVDSELQSSPVIVTVMVAAAQERERHDELAWPLDPLMEMLMRFENDAQLDAMIAQIFQVVLRCGTAYAALREKNKGMISLFVSTRRAHQRISTGARHVECRSRMGSITLAAIWRRCVSIWCNVCVNNSLSRCSCATRTGRGG